MVCLRSEDALFQSLDVPSPATAEREPSVESSANCRTVQCTTEGKRQRRRDEKAWALNYGSGEGGGVEKGRRRGGEKRAMYV